VNVKYQLPGKRMAASLPRSKTAIVVALSLVASSSAMAQENLSESNSRLSTGNRTWHTQHSEHNATGHLGSITC